MRTFAYERARDVEHATRLGSETEATFLGGGTNLVDLMRLGVERPALVIDVTGLGHDRIEETDDGGLRIGAAVRNSDLAADSRVQSRYQGLSSALLHGASGQLRNMATTAGNLLQRTRCAYFQDVTRPCNKRDPGSGCPARDGEHRNLAILGWSEQCVATHPSDMAVSLVAFDAVVHTSRRSLLVEALYRPPDGDPSRETVLERGELIEAVELPALPAGSNSLYLKVRERASFSFAVVSVAAVLSDGDMRIALGGVAHKPWRARRAEQALREGADFAEAAEAELEEARPLRDNAYKVKLARNLIVQALEELAR